MKKNIDKNISVSIKKNLQMKISTLVAYIAMVAINYMAILIPLGGRTTGEISDNYPNLFTPAGYAFSIWGLIYTLLGIYAVYQLFVKKYDLIGRINRLFIINALLNASWIFAWHYNIIWLSVIIIIGLLITLILIADILRINKLTKKEKWIVRLPFSIYFGWITVATIANISIFLVSIGWNGCGLPDTFWTIIILLAGSMIGTLRMIKDRFPSYGLVLIWAYGAILAKHLSANGFAGKYPNIIYTVIICLFIFAGTEIYININKKIK